MYFLLAYLIIGISCVIISGRTLIAYTECSVIAKSLIYISLLYAWFSPILVWTTQTKNILSVWEYTVFAKISYFLFGFAFILFMVLAARDILWVISYWLSDKTLPSPENHTALKYANIISLIVVLTISIYAVYAAEKAPQILHYKYSDLRIKHPLKALLISDMHITKMTPRNKVAAWVKQFNALKPDIIFLPGDIADDKTSDIKKQIKELQKLKAPLGIYYTLGNHEVYFNALAWEGEFAALGWQVLHNSGVTIPDTGLYIAGIPDASTLSTNIKQAVKQASPEHYRILLSHIPSTILNAQKGEVDLQVSGHTHGGQIFPFNILTKLGNKGFVFGEYILDNAKLLISRGVGYWGPPMRLGAPNDVILIEFSNN